MMRKNHMLKKTAAAVLTVSICLGTVSGCGSGAESQEDAVSLKEQNGEQTTGQMTANGAATSENVVEQVQAPEIYQAKVTGDAVTITADAVIIIPDVPGIKLKKVTARTFTQEDYDAVNRVLLGSETLWDIDYEAMKESHGMFREQIDERIMELEKKIAQDGLDGDTTYNSKGITLNEQIEEYKSLREYAISEKEAEERGLILEIPAIVTYDEALSETNENSLFGNVTVDGQDYWLRIDNNATAASYRVEFLIGKQDGDGNYLSFSNSLPDWNNLPEYMGDIRLKPGFVNMNTPPEEVLTKASEAIGQMGLGEYAVQGGGYFACWSADEYVMDSAAYRASTYLAGIGYGVHFVRVVDGIPITYTYEDGGSLTGEDGEKWLQAMEKGIDYVPEVVYWPYEEMMLIYNNDGFRTFEWKNPYTVEDMSEEYVFLLPFSDISNIFEEMLLKRQADSFNNEGDTVDIQVDKVVLSYMRVRDKDSLEGTLIPVWDFFGTKTFKNAAGEVDLVADRVYDGALPESLMTINAMDGTIVDRWAGY